MLITNTGDLPVLNAARQEARNAFRKNASLREGDPKLALAIAHAEDVSRILKENIVQGIKTDDERYSEFVLEKGDKETLMADWKIELRMHEYTERGDNDTVKLPNGQNVVINGKKCSDR